MSRFKYYTEKDEIFRDNVNEWPDFEVHICKHLHSLLSKLLLYKWFGLVCFAAVRGLAHEGWLNQDLLFKVDFELVYTTNIQALGGIWARELLNWRPQR